MQESTEFSYTYSAASNREAREIREKYMPRQESKLEKLKRLDRRVQSSGMVQGLSVGIAGFLLFGLGLCMSMEIVGARALLGVFVGLLGMAVMFFAYPVYRLILDRAKKKYVPRILELTSELIGDKVKTQQ